LAQPVLVFGLDIGRGGRDGGRKAWRPPQALRSTFDGACGPPVVRNGRATADQCHSGRASVASESRNPVSTERPVPTSCNIANPVFTGSPLSRGRHAENAAPCKLTSWPG